MHKIFPKSLFEQRYLPREKSKNHIADLGAEVGVMWHGILRLACNPWMFCESDFAEYCSYVLSWRQKAGNGGRSVMTGMFTARKSPAWFSLAFTGNSWEILVRGVTCLWVQFYLFLKQLCILSTAAPISHFACFPHFAISPDIINRSCLRNKSFYRTRNYKT